MSGRVANRRIRLLLAVFACVFAATFVRAAWLQGVRAQSLSKLAATQHRQQVEIPAPRGTIYDRSGVQLAIGEQATTVYADPLQVKDPQAVARAVARALGLDEEKVYAEISDRSRGFVYLQRKADPARAARLARQKLAGLGFYPEERRFYPQRSVASQVIGYAGVDNRGLAGLELASDKQLAGRAGSETIVRDPFGRALEVVSDVSEREGTDLWLTLDHTIQANAESVLRDTVRRWNAKSASAIVLDPRTGEVLAMAVAPTYDANQFPGVWRVLQRNRAVTDTYEPGSTFKLVTVGASLSEGLVTPWTKFRLKYEIQVADRKIHDAEHRSTETMTVARILSQSSNVGAITLAQKLGRERLQDWISRFGFGRQTGIDFPGESPGILPSYWSGSTIGNVPIGQGIAVTPLQMASAYAALANGGVRVQPHLIDHIRGDRPLKPDRERVVTPQVASLLLDMLRAVVADGSGELAAVPGYETAGKTGTAAKPDPAGGYSDTRYVASFVGIVPASAPRLVVLVSIDEPQGAIFGGTVAAPAFRDIARFALQYLEVPPDDPASLGWDESAPLG